MSESTQPDVGRGQVKVPWCLLKPLEFFCGYVDCKGLGIISFEFCADHLQAELNMYCMYTGGSGPFLYYFKGHLLLMTFMM